MPRLALEGTIRLQTDFAIQFLVYSEVKVVEQIFANAHQKQFSIDRRSCVVRSFSSGVRIFLVP